MLLLLLHATIFVAATLEQGQFDCITIDLLQGSSFEAEDDGGVYLESAWGVQGTIPYRLREDLFF